MSLILDAINRSQRERANPGEVPGIATQHYVDSSPPRAGWQLPLLLVALVIALAVITWLLLRPAPEAAAPVAGNPAPATTAPAPARESAPAMQSKAETGVTTDAPTPSPAAPDRMTELASSIGPAASEVPGDAAKSQQGEDGQALGGESASDGEAAVAALYADAEDQVDEVDAKEDAAGSSQTPVADAAPAPAPEPASPVRARPGEQVDIEALMRRAREEVDAAALPPHPAPMLGALSQQQKDAIPTLLYSAHDYRGDGGSSSVLINGNSAQAGGRVAQGVQVTEILPDSVILEHAGKSFRLKALSSWVNL